MDKFMTSFLGFTLSPWLVIPVVYLIWVTMLLSLKKIFTLMIKRWTRRTHTRFDDIFVRAADFPLTLLIFTSGGLIIEKMLPETPSNYTNYFLIGFKAVTILAVILFFDKLINSTISYYSGRVMVLKTSSGVVQVFARILVIGLGMLILLDSFGVSITPILASLGIGSLAIALALQPTLENLFAGIQIVADRPFEVGHFIKLDSGEEGYVQEIGWRKTVIRMLPNNAVIIPNKLLVNSRVVNYYYPDKELAVLVEVGVHYNSDLEKVEKVTAEVAKETLQNVSGGVATFNPFIRIHTFDDFSINFTVILRAKEFTDQYLIKHEFIKRLHKRYNQEGIVIPYPIQSVNFDQEKAFAHRECQDELPKGKYNPPARG